MYICRMEDFKIDFENRIYTMSLESSNVTADTIDVKIIMYKTTYSVFKNRTTNTWHNNISKFELGKGILKEIGKTLDEIIK